jgi:phosphohistidine phosphatase
MARLFLLRHAKSSWDDPGVRDFDRPLNLRGRAAAPLMGRHMADHALIPDRVLCSAARRTRETFGGILPFLPGDFEARFLGGIYECSSETYLPLIRRHGEGARRLMLIGHNPVIQETAISLIGRGNPDLAGAIAEKFPTAGLAVIDFDGDGWADVKPKSGRIVAFFRPRELEVVGEPGGADADD